MPRLLLLLVTCSIANLAVADSQIRDGRYDARVRTDSGSYRVPVEVENGEVTRIIWPNGGRMRIRGAEIDGGEAYGRNSEGDRVRIEIDSLEYDEED